MIQFLVLSSHTPIIIQTGNSQNNWEVLYGASHFNPISNEWRDILDPPETTNTPDENPKHSVAAIKNTDEKKRAGQKTTSKTTAMNNTLH